MYGEFVMLSSEGEGGYGGPVGTGNILRRSAREVYEHEVPDYFGNPTVIQSGGNSTNNTTHSRHARQTVNPPKNGAPTEQPKSNRYVLQKSYFKLSTVRSIYH